MTDDLFSEEPGFSAYEQLKNAIDAWIAVSRDIGRLKRTSSESYYRSMWSSFTEWCLGQDPPVKLSSLTADDLCACVASRKGIVDPAGDLTARYTWRMLNLVDRVLKLQCEAEGRPRNLAAVQAMTQLPGVTGANDPSRANLPGYLQADEARALVAYLSSIRPRGGQQRGALRVWQEIRNRAAVGLQLGAGLTPGDVRALTLGSVISAGGKVADVPWKLVVPADGNTPERETPVARWAGQLLKYWLEVREEMAIPGDRLFPSVRSGKPWNKKAHYNAAQEVLEDAGINARDGGSFRLRHTFALRQLRRGKAPEEVARWMGIAKLENMQRYARILHVPIDVE